MATYILNDEKMFCDIADGVAIVINSETGIYYGLNSFATHLFENILNGADTVAVLALLQDLPDGPDDIKIRFDSFIQILLEKELVLLGNTQGEAHIDMAIAQADNFTMEVKEYNDAQELLLADPIHEVKEDKGWTPEKDSLEIDEDVVKEKHKKLEY